MPELELLSVPDSELVIGLVAPVGTDLNSVSELISTRLGHFRYSSSPVRISEIIRRFEGLTTELKDSSYADYLDSHMTAGNEARTLFKRGDVLALAAVSQMHKARGRDDAGSAQPLYRTAHILRSLKHPDEAQTLRAVYGPGCFLIGVNSSYESRLKYLVEDKNVLSERARDLMKRDEAEGDKLGQRVRDTFEQCDAFVAIDASDFKGQMWRVLDLLFGNPILTPTRDEYAMFLAYGAALRSADLSRQVGAVICSAQGEIIATGANDVPRYGGGLYWADDPDDDRDYKWEYDTNVARRDEIILAVMRELSEAIAPSSNAELLEHSKAILDGSEVLTALNSEEKEKLAQEIAERLASARRSRSDEELLQRGRESLKTTGILDLTEFGRPVHAEMEALLSCARSNRSPRDGTLYSTTFPCHNCAKHIVAAGVKRVVYVEPYPKSLALKLHPDSIMAGLPQRQRGTATRTVKVASVPQRGKVSFVPFVGIGPRRFVDLFSMRLSSGREVERKGRDGRRLPWERGTTTLRVPMAPTSYLDRELLAISALNRVEDGQSNAEA